MHLEQIKKIKSKAKIQVEVFIHGAMCVSVSGRCFLSHYLFNKSANRGECIQPCRRKFILKDIEEKHELELGKDYLISPKDLCTIDIIDKLIKAKIDCFKIEGRMRSPEYIKTVTEVYREAIDNPKTNKSKLKEKLKTVYNRGFSTGFYLGKPIKQWTNKYGSKAKIKKQYIGKVLNFYNKPSVAEVKIESNQLRLGDQIMFQGDKTGVKTQSIQSMQINKKQIKQAKKGKTIGIKTKAKIRKNDKIYKLSSKKA